MTYIMSQGGSIKSVAGCMDLVDFSETRVLWYWRYFSKKRGQSLQLRVTSAFICLVWLPIEYSGKFRSTFPVNWTSPSWRIRDHPLLNQRYLVSLVEESICFIIYYSNKQNICSSINMTSSYVLTTSKQPLHTHAQIRYTYVRSYKIS